MNINVIYAAKGIKTSDFDPSESIKPDDYSTAVTKTNKIISTLSIIGMIISVVMLMVLGIKYMMGSLSEKAEYKKSMIPMIIGAVLIFTSSTIVLIIYNISIKIKI